MISQRLKEIVEALPVSPDSRILEIGCGPGVAAREIARRLRKGYVLAIDRSEKAIQQAIRTSKEEIESGRLRFQCVAAENFELGPGEDLFDFAFAIRVGALDGRHPEIAAEVLRRIAAATTAKGKLYIDGGNLLKEIKLVK